MNNEPTTVQFDYSIEIPGQTRPYTLSERFDLPLSFREFLRIRKELLAHYREWESAIEYDAVSAIYPPWPAELEGITEEEIQQLL